MAKQFPVPNEAIQFDFSFYNAEDFTPMLNTLLHSKKWVDAMTKRNHLAKQVASQRCNNFPVIKSVRIMDERLALILYNAILEYAKTLRPMEITTVKDLTSSTSLTPEQRQSLGIALNKFDALTFLNDIMLGILNEAIASVNAIGDDTFAIPELHDVKASLEILYKWGQKRRAEETEEQRELFNGYADSIEQYLNGRIKTYIEKYRKLEKANKSINK